MPKRRTVPLLLNRLSGGAAGDEAIAGRLAEALGRQGIDAEAESVDGDRIAARAAAAREAGARLLIVAGGDGSVGAAAGALAGSDTALGLLPLGTRNHFARDLGIPPDLDEAAAVIARGHSRRVDVAQVNGRSFVNNSVIGLYPLMVLDRESQQERLGRSKRLALAVAAVRTLARFRKRRLMLSADEEDAGRLDTPLLFVGNNSYSLELATLGRRERLDSGELCVLVMRRKSRLGFIAAAFRAMAGRARSDDLVRLPALERLRVESALGLLNVSLDGETVQLRPPLHYRIRKQALEMIAPPPADQAPETSQAT